MTGRRPPAARPAGPAPPAVRPRRRLRGSPLVVALLVIAAAIIVTVKLTAHPAQPCQASFVPAFFAPQGWAGSASGGRSPAVLILNPASGPGPAPDPAFRSAVRAAARRGTKIIGYIGTDYARLPLPQAERQVRDYRSWYGVTGIFLDQTPTEGDAQIGYYRTLAAVIRAPDRGAVIWLNPGTYPDRSYLSVASVIMAFEGPYSSYLTARIPAWARRYPARRFAHTVYATPGADVAAAVRMSRQRNAGYLYLTDDVGPDPYSALPHYWPREQAAVAGSCS